MSQTEAPAAEVETPEKVGKQGLTLAQREALLGWGLLVPTILVLLGVALYPLLQTFYLSLTDARLGGTAEPAFIGLENYIGEYGLLNDPRFIQAVGTTVAFTVVSVFIETVLGLGIALVINSKFPGRGLMRAAILVPWAIPTVVSAQMWRWMYNDVFGVVNDLFLRLGLIDKPIAWLANTSTALAAIIAVDVWKTTPFMALLLLAGLQVIPGDVYEAAKVDGAGKLRQFISITFPLLRPALVVALIFRTLDALRVFDVFFVMKKDLHTMATYDRLQLIDFQQQGYGSAISVIIFVLIFLFVVLYVSILGVEEQ